MKMIKYSFILLFVLSSIFSPAAGKAAAQDSLQTLAMMVRTAQGEMLLFPFRDGSFQGAGESVGKKWDSTDYMVADWTGDGIPDMMARNTNASLILYPFQDGAFNIPGGPQKVGSKFNFVQYLPADWNADSTADLVVLNDQGDLILHPFVNRSFQPSKTIGRKFDFAHYFVAYWTGVVTPDMIVRSSAGDLLLYSMVNNTLYGAGEKVGKGWNFTGYFPAGWP